MTIIYYKGFEWLAQNAKDYDEFIKKLNDLNITGTYDVEFNDQRIDRRQINKLISEIKH